MNIWLAYVSYPTTTATYVERALRRYAQVTTVGPRFPMELIETWHLQNLRLPFTDHDIVTPFEPNVADLIAAAKPDNRPDLYVWVESVCGYFPEGLESLTCATACWLIDTHLNLTWHLKWAKHFKYVFLAQREYVQTFRNNGLNAHWLPLACDPEIHAPVSLQKKYDISFVGSLSHNPRRQSLLKRLDDELGIYCERCWWDDMARVISQSRMTFNNAVKNDLNMRVFEALSIGTLLLTDRAPDSGLETLFHDGEELAIYRNDDELLDVTRFYLSNPLLQGQIAQRGQQIVHNAHTYQHRMHDLLAVTLHGKAATWTAAELREQSLVGLSAPFALYMQQQTQAVPETRSFVIPVLDYSPASPYNIITLLADLETIPGEVIVIFNNPLIGEELKKHPRITRSATMSENIGVARAWNVGISMATTPFVIVLNADLHVEAPVFEAIEQGLQQLDKAACVGPQGSFVNYRLTKDFLYFDKGSFDNPVAVDAVSGFLFGVRRELFGPGGLKFEEAYTPCYFEEWDLGLQIRQQGLKSWIVPADSYSHHWGGSIRGRHEIECLGRTESAQQILRRNRAFFLYKWRTSDGYLPESGWKLLGPEYLLNCLADGANDESIQTAISALQASYPDDARALAVSIFTAFSQHNVVKATALAKQLSKKSPSFDLNVFLKNPNYTIASFPIEQAATEFTENPGASAPFVIDGVFFQYRNTGIARVWEELLQQWASSSFSSNILVLDRNGTCPRFKGISYRTIPPHDYANLEADRQLLQQICDEAKAACFISTYYTTPLTTPSVVMIHDCIPESLGADLEEPAWIEKRHAIVYAAAFYCVSAHTAAELLKHYPDAAGRPLDVSHHGVPTPFYPADDHEVTAFRDQYRISKPYFLFVGPVEWYKNFKLFIDTFATLPNYDAFQVVRTCHENGEPIHPLCADPQTVITTGRLSDSELRAAYSGALALIYPSWYEGFGLPVLEAMACGCPVIAANTTSIPEVAGTAALLIPPNDHVAMAQALLKIQSEPERNRLREAGLKRAQMFNQQRSASRLQQLLQHIAEQP